MRSEDFSERSGWGDARKFRSLPPLSGSLGERRSVCIEFCVHWPNRDLPVLGDAGAEFTTCTNDVGSFAILVRGEID